MVPRAGLSASMRALSVAISSWDDKAPPLMLLDEVRLGISHNFSQFRSGNYAVCSEGIIVV